MSDTPAESAPSSSTPSTGDQTASPPASAPPVSTGGDDPFGELPDEPLFPRSYVEKLRTEGAKYRTEAQQAKTAAERAATYDEVYGVYDDQDRQVWMDLARTWAVDPSRAASVMDQIARSVLDDGKDEPGEEAQTDQADELGIDTKGLTPEAVQQMIEEALMTREQSAAEAKAIDGIYGEVRSHGYDPESREGFMVLWTANNETDGDIGAAVEKMKQYRQGIIDDYVAGRTGGSMPTPGPNGGVAANKVTEINSFEDARKATEAFLRSQHGAGP